MSNSINDYRKMVDEPWGKMFYDMIFEQLNIPNDKRIKILDFGAGFCISATHYAKDHEVIALEPNEEMINLRVEGDYKLIHGGLDFLSNFEDNTFDVVICHNVLEYVDNKDEIIKGLIRVVKPEGKLSIIKHNLYGRVIAMAVLGDNPKAALDLLGEENTENSMFGNRNVYDNEYLVNCLKDEAKLKDVFGIRTFFGLSSNNEIKYSDDWYKPMLELEKKTYALDEFKKLSFFNHLIFVKG